MEAAYNEAGIMEIICYSSFPYNTNRNLDFLIFFFDLVVVRTIIRITTKLFNFRNDLKKNNYILSYINSSSAIHVSVLRLHIKFCKIYLINIKNFVYF